MYILFFFLLQACSPASFLSSSLATMDATSQERGLGGFVSDKEIKIRLNFMLFEHDHVLHVRTNVHVYEGNVLLTGILPKQSMKTDLVRIAWNVPGVRTVIDETLVAQANDLGDFLADKWLNTKINTALFMEPDVQSRNYQVHSVRGIVYVMGLAYSDKELKKAIDTLRVLEGVKKVVTYVRVLTPEERKRRKVFNRKRESPLQRKRQERRGFYGRMPRSVSS